MILAMAEIAKRRVHITDEKLNLKSIKSNFSRELINLTRDGINNYPSELSINFQRVLSHPDSILLLNKRTGKYVLSLKQLEYAMECSNNSSFKYLVERIHKVTSMYETIIAYEEFLGTKNSMKGYYQIKVQAKLVGGKIQYRKNTGIYNPVNVLNKGIVTSKPIFKTYYNQLGAYAGIYDLDWTFLSSYKGKRESEAKYLELILNGAISPDTLIGLKVIKAYRSRQESLGDSILFRDTAKERLEEVDNLTTQLLSKGYDIYSLNDFDMTYARNFLSVRKKTTTYVGYYGSYCYDVDNNVFLDDINMLLGNGGEFTSTKSEDTFSEPTELVIDGRLKNMYMLKSNTYLSLNDLVPIYNPNINISRDTEVSVFLEALELSSSIRAVSVERLTHNAITASESILKQYEMLINKG